MQTKNSIFGYLFALAAIFFWSFNLIIASYFATSLTPWEIAFGRWFVACLILVPMAWKGLKKNRKLLVQNLELIFWLAITGIVLDNTLIYYAGETASAINMGLLDVTGPIFLVVMSWTILKSPITFRQVTGLLIAIFGVLIIILQGNLTELAKVKFVAGDFWMLLNTFCFAVYSFLQVKRPPEISQPTMLAATAVLGVILIFPIMLFTVDETQFFNLKPIDFEVMIYLGIFNSVLSYLAWNSALARIGNIKTSIIYYLLPLFSGIEAYFILGEKIYSSDIIGGILIIGGIMVVTLRKTAPQPQTEKDLK